MKMVYQPKPPAEMQYIHAYPRTTELIRNHSPVHANKLADNPNEAYRNLGRQCQDIQIGATITKIIDLCLSCPAGRETGLRNKFENMFKTCQDEDCCVHVELDIVESVVDCLLEEIQEQIKNTAKHQADELAKKLPRELANMVVSYNDNEWEQVVVVVLYNIFNYDEPEPELDSSYDLSDGDESD